jgi:hypothetical protein
MGWALGLGLYGATAAAQGLAPYDPAPLLASVRPEMHGPLAQAAGPLHRLPLYDLTLRLADNGRDFTLREAVTVTNTERAPLRDLVLRVYGNAPRPPANAAQGGAQAARPSGAARTLRAGELRGRRVYRGRGSRRRWWSCASRSRSRRAPRCGCRSTSPETLPEIAPGRTNILTQGLESLSSLGSAAAEGGGDYGLLATGDGIVSLAHFYAVLARRTGGQWERVDRGGVGDLGSDDLAHVRAAVELPAGYTVATTGVTARTVAQEGGRQRHEVVAGAVRDFAVMAGRTLQSATRRVGDVEVRSYFLPAHRAAGEQVLDTAARSLEEFVRRFGPYPYRDLDVVEAPLVGGAGGVEFPGLVTVATMFYRPTQAAPRATGGGGATGGAGGLGGLLGGLLGRRRWR